MDLKAIIDFLTTGLTGKLLYAALILAVGTLVIRIIMKLIRGTLDKSKLEKAAHGLILSLARTLLWLLVILAVLKALEVDITGAVALASVLTLAVSLAMQNMLSNVVGGFTLLYNHPFRSGDFVEIAGQSGQVEEINMAYTRLATPDNKVISLPNSAVVAAQIVNYSATRTRRVDLEASASYNASTEEVIAALIEAGTVEGVLTEPAPFAAVTAYGESAISYTLRLWVNTADYWAIYFLVNQRIKTVFDRKGIEMTYPHLNVHLDK